MLALKKILFSSIGKKYIMAISGLGLIGFLVMHVAGNLTLLTGNPDLINAYGAKLKGTLGPAFYPVELALLGLFFVHFAMAAYIHLVEKKAARPEGYRKSQKGKGGNSKFGLASTKMIFSGGAILAFLVMHLVQIRINSEFGSKLTTTISGTGEEVTDLYRYCADLFASPIMTAIYVGAMILMGVHLRHGFWSAIQSLGAMKPEWSKAIYGLALIIAIVLALSFLVIPIWMHLDLSGSH